MKILVAHPSPTVEDGMVVALGEEFGARVVAVRTERHLRRAVDDGEVDLAVLDVDFAPGLATTLCHELSLAGVRVVVLTRPDREGHLELLASGAAGIAVASDGLTGLVTALRTVTEGHVHVPPHLLGAVLHEVIVVRRNEQPSSAHRLGSLSPREREVLGLLGGGADTREIAATLVISPYTAKTHINRLLGKLGLASRTEAAAFAVSHDVRSAPLEVSRD
jgi:DNA-binding NarL/FixJ family response regulator